MTNRNIGASNSTLAEAKRYFCSNSVAQKDRYGESDQQWVVQGVCQLPGTVVTDLQHSKSSQLAGLK
ncbi:hypothetical protein LshimejAT787_1200280 [Lyophyllum shimeji]|uniref:Uncharacterized protein n=1 Tax=Lyophyllum shimeji TaxID=47721 RepID=A0A9P3UPB9_LYOSH|nr:hypothetical protein LshimejAT787_1200280 [Lyophyllum shimeji]